MADGFLSSSILIGAEALVCTYGRDPATIAHRANLPRAALRDPGMIVPAGPVFDFFELAARHCGEPAWGLRLGSGTRLSVVVGPLWILLRNAGTVAQMWRDFAANFDLYTGAAHMRFKDTDEGGLLEWSAATGVSESEKQMAEFAMAVFCNEIRTHCGVDWYPRAIQFRHTAPGSLRRHHDVLGAELLFNQNCNALLLDKKTLAQPLRSGTPHARSLVRAVLRHGKEVEASSLSAQVESVIRALLPLAPCSVQNISLAMGTSPRTLQARLARHGSSFKQIKDRVRADLSLKYLRDSSLSVGQVADLLGYSDLTAFSRSFRRWHGCSARSIRASRAASADRSRTTPDN